MATQHEVGNKKSLLAMITLSTVQLSTRTYLAIITGNSSIVSSLIF